jgi:hypothetical protein
MKPQDQDYKSAPFSARCAGFQPAVSRISNPPVPQSANLLPTAFRRYSRLKACPTASCACSFVLSLLLGAFSASALQNSTPGFKPGSTTAPVNPRPGHTHLTPAAPMSSQVPASSEEDIRDIRQPRHLPTPIPWAGAAAGVILLSAAAFAAWKWLRRRKFMALAPGEIALQQLEKARRLMDPEHAREYCFAVSEIMRNYIEVQFRVHAPRLTTEEFLRELVEVRETMLASHRTLLGGFLEHCDLAKFAGWRYSMPALEEMHSTARSFVQQASRDAASPKPEGTLPTPATTAGESSVAATSPEPIKTAAA